MRVHLVKLAVGADGVDDLPARRERQLELAKKQGLIPVMRHVTRHAPKRGDEVLNGGSLYWVIRGSILARQAIVGFEPVAGEDGVARCAILLDPDITLTRPRARRPFQGWRYLEASDAPRDIAAGERSDTPAHLESKLSDLGLL